MLSQHLLIHSEAIKPTIKEIKAKTQNRLFYDPSWTHKGGSGGKTDRLFRLSIYAFPIPFLTFLSYKSNNKGDIRQKLKIANLISKLNFYKLIPYPMDNCFTGRCDRSRQTPEKDVLYIIPAGPVSSVHSLGGASYLLPVQTE